MNPVCEKLLLSAINVDLVKLGKDKNSKNSLVRFFNNLLIINCEV